MRKDFFERDYGHLQDTDDWSSVFGRTVHAGIWTVGDIRRRLEDHPPDASIHLESNGADFFISDFKSKLFTV
jgi:hypothetical protein